MAGSRRLALSLSFARYVGTSHFSAASARMAYRGLAQRAIPWVHTWSSADRREFRRSPGRRIAKDPGFAGARARLTHYRGPGEQPESARWGGAQASRRPAQGADRQPIGTRCLDGHHASGPQRVHLLGRRCQAGDDPGTAHSPDRGGARGRPASALLLARVHAPRAHRQIAGCPQLGQRPPCAGSGRSQSCPGRPGR